MPDAIDAAIDSVPDSIDATPVEAAPEGVTAEAAPDAPQSAEESIDAALEAIYDKNNPPRSEDGKYKATKAEEAAAEGEQEITDQPQTEDDGQPQKVATEPPQSWSAAQREMWAKIPPEARDYIAQRETEATKTISRMGQELSRFRPLNELLSRHQDTFARHGADAQTGISRLLDVQHTHRVFALPPRQARAGDDGDGVAGVGQADAPAEEQQHVLRGVLPSPAAASPAPHPIARTELEDP